MSIRAEMGLRIAVAALLAGAAAYVLITFFFLAPDEEDDLIPPAAPDPAAYQVAEILEEARAITREASQ